MATLLGEFQEVFEEGRPDDHTLSFKNCRTTFTSPAPSLLRQPHCFEGASLHVKSSPRAGPVQQLYVTVGPLAHALHAEYT